MPRSMNPLAYTVLLAMVDMLIHDTFLAQEEEAPTWLCKLGEAVT